jgi:hypothetical protein
LFLAAESPLLFLSGAPLSALEKMTEDEGINFFLKGERRKI